VELLGKVLFKKLDKTLYEKG